MKRYCSRVLSEDENGVSEPVSLGTITIQLSPDINSSWASPKLCKSLVNRWKFFDKVSKAVFQQYNRSLGDNVGLADNNTGDNLHKIAGFTMKKESLIYTHHPKVAEGFIISNDDLTNTGHLAGKEYLLRNRIIEFFGVNRSTLSRLAAILSNTFDREGAIVVLDGERFFVSSDRVPSGRVTKDNKPIMQINPDWRKLYGIPSDS